MPIVSDFVVVDERPPFVSPNFPYRTSFNTGGRDGGTSAYLSMETYAAELTFGRPAVVELNGREVGRVFSDFQTDFVFLPETVVFDGSDLRSGTNRLEISIPDGRTGEYLLLSNLVCHFHQRA